MSVESRYRMSQERLEELKKELEFEEVMENGQTISKPGSGRDER